MTAEQRFERHLPEILEGLYLGPTPDYRDEVLAAAVVKRQRPAWTFPGRWIPMADIASRPAYAPRVPWRTFGMALILIALLLAALFAYVGSRQTKVPPPFGLAANGLIAYAAEGDIHTLDPVTGLTTAIVTGPENTFDPVFSHDGTRVAFRRDTTRNGSPAEEIVVVAADGSNPVVVTAQLDAQPGYFEWAPDSRSILVEEPNGAAIWELDATTAATPREVATNASMPLRPFRPPNGDQILIQRTVDSIGRYVLLDLASGTETVLVSGEPGLDLGGARWSADGSQVVYTAQPATAPDSRRLFVVNVDGSAEPRQLTDGTRNEFDIDPVWSHDGSLIAFTRYEQLGPDNWDVRPIVLYSVPDGQLREVGPRARDIRARAPNEADAFASAGEGLYLEFSPDATTLIAMPSEATGHAAIVDLRDGSYQIVGELFAPVIAANIWQRKAP